MILKSHVKTISLKYGIQKDLFVHVAKVLNIIQLGIEGYSSVNADLN